MTLLERKRGSETGSVSPAGFTPTGLGTIEGKNVTKAGIRLQDVGEQHSVSGNQRASLWSFISISSYKGFSVQTFTLTSSQGHAVKAQIPPDMSTDCL